MNFKDIALPVMTITQTKPQAKPCLYHQLPTLPLRRNPTRRPLLLSSLALLLALTLSPSLIYAELDAVAPSDRLLLADALYSRGMYEQARREYAVLAADTKAPERAAILFHLAESCRRLNLDTDAETSYSRLINEFPQSPHYVQAQLQRAVLATKANRFKESAALLTPLLSKNTIQADLAPALHQAMAEALEGSGDTENSLKHYKELYQRFPQSDFAAPAAIKSAYALTQSGQYDAAATLYRDAVKLAKTPRVAAEALFQLGQSQLAGKKTRDAVNTFNELRLNHPKDSRTRDAAPSAAWACHDTADYAAVLSWIPPDNGLPRERDTFLYLRADSERRRGRLTEAIMAYQAFITQCPKSPRLSRARYELLLSLFNSGRHADLLTAAKDLQPEANVAADVIWMRAEASATLKHNDAAIALYRELGEKHPKSPLAADAWIRAGWLLQNRQEWSAAAAAFEKVATLYPKHQQTPQALYAAGVCQARAGNSEAALSNWNTLITTHPGFKETDEALFQSGLELLRLKKNTAAIKLFDKLITEHPKANRLTEAHYWRAVLHHQLDNTTAAIADFQTVLKGDAAANIISETRLTLGTLLLQQDKLNEAATVFQPLLEGTTRDTLPPDRLAWLAEFQFNRKAFTEAEAAARALAQRKQQDDGWVQTGWALLGRSLRAQKKNTAAIEAYTHAAAIKSETRYLPEALLRLGELLTDDGKFSDAEKYLRDAVAKTSAPEWQGIRAHAYAALGRCAETRGQNEEALRYYLSVALLYDDPTLVPVALDKAAALHTALGRVTEGEAVGHELITRYPDSPQAKAWQARLSTNGGRP